MDNSHRNAFTGSTFDDFLLEEGLHEEVETAAIQRVIAWKENTENAKAGNSNRLKRAKEVQ
jgi:hypothetical protein